jgi:hypothetical protein
MDSPDLKETVIMTAWILVSDASRANLFSAELREDDGTYQGATGAM